MERVTAAVTRVYLPATTGSLAALVAHRRLDATLATAVTADLRAALPGCDEEELELEALLDAAELSLELVGRDPEAAARRVVVAADLPTGSTVPAPEQGVAVVRLRAPVLFDAVASVHVDEPSAAAAVLAGQVEDLDLLWYAPQEIAGLLE